MEKQLRKSQTLYSLSAFFFFGLCILFSIVGYNLKIDIVYFLIIIICMMGILTHIIYVHRLHKSLLTLIQMSERIIEHNHNDFPVIDGESYISILSSHLQLLNLRMRAMIDNLTQEQDHLKTYIENISHQIKTPLTAMFLKEDILLETTSGQTHQIVEQIVFQTQKIHQCIESLLHLAQLDSHCIVYHKDEYLLSEIMDSVISHLKAIMDKNDVTFRMDISNQMVYCDFQWISEAIENILKNCIEQKEHNVIDIICYEQSTYSVIKILDHGDGFYEEDIQHIFERFYRSQYQKDKQGIGIGLSITQEIIKDHHGIIRAYNQDGAVFEITLPKKSTKSKYLVTNE